VHPVGVPRVTTSRGETTIYPDGFALPSARPSSRESETHDSSLGFVYANALAREGFTKDGLVTKFPVGSVIVREKLSRETDVLPQLVAAMIKRPPGFNPKGGDWEFLIADGKLTKVRERQKTGSCLKCHSSQAERDFVYPLPESK
jgi:hypothetical protein